MMRPDKLFQHKFLLNQYLACTASKLSTNSFVNLFAWSDFFEFSFKEIDQNLLVFAKDLAGIFLYLMPLGERLSLKAVQVAFEEMEKVNGNSRLSRIENVDESRIKYFPKEQYTIDLKSYEYCYYRQDIAGLKGNTYKSQRAAVNQFVKNNLYQYLPFEMSMKNECLNLFRHWKAQKEKSINDDMFRFMLEDNEKVHARILGAANDLEMIGRVVKVDGQIKAYTVGYALNKEIFCVLFEITDVAFRGIANFIFSQFCQDEALKPFRFINVMDDFGLPQVNQTKMSYHPVMLVPSYTISLP